MVTNFSTCKTKKVLDIAIYSAVQELIYAIQEASDVSVELACSIICRVCESTIEDCLKAAFSKDL